jgi:hypothetical protein
VSQRSDNEIGLADTSVARQRDTGMSDDGVGDGLVKVSDLMIEHPEARSFEDLKRLVRAAATSGYRFLQFDVKPEFVDTPRNWDLVLETVFYQGGRPGS